MSFPQILHNFVSILHLFFMDRRRRGRRTMSTVALSYRKTTPSTAFSPCLRWKEAKLRERRGWLWFYEQITTEIFEEDVTKKTTPKASTMNLRGKLCREIYVENTTEKYSQKTPPRGIRRKHHREIYEKRLSTGLRSPRLDLGASAGSPWTPQEGTRKREHMEVPESPEQHTIDSTRTDIYGHWHR